MPTTVSESTRPEGFPDEAGCFRNSEFLEAVVGTVFAHIAERESRGGTIRAWVPGCVGGEEVYLLAIVLLEFLQSYEPFEYSVQIFGTDASDEAIAKARAGDYSENELAGVSPERLRRFFYETEKGYRVNRSLRKKCIFSRHDIRTDSFLARMDLIVWRELRGGGPPTRTLAGFGYALNSGGALVLAFPEKLDIPSNCFSALDEGHRIYRKEDLDRQLFRSPESKTRLSARIAIKPHAIVAKVKARRLRKTRVLLSPGGKTGKTRPGEDLTMAEPAKPDRFEIKGKSLSPRLSPATDRQSDLIEELRSTIEELQTANEELKSANEELQTAQEELQSSNQELNTLNAEIEEHHAEMSLVNNDVLNLLQATNIPIVMIGNDLKIRRFTPMAKKILELIPADVGRPIADLNKRIDAPDLERLLQRVIETLLPYEQEVRDLEGRAYLMRLRPYLTMEHRIEGAVVQLLDITNLKRSMDQVNHALAYAEAIVDTIHEPLVVLDEKLSIRDANRAFYGALKLPLGAGAGRSIYEIAGGCFDIPAVRGLWEAIRKQAEFNDVEIAIRLPDGAEKIFLLNARPMGNPANDSLILLAFDDITERKRNEDASYARLFESARDGIAILDADTGEILDANPFLQQLLGYKRKEMIGRKLSELEPLQAAAQVRTALAQILTEGMLRLDDVPVRTRNGTILRTDVIASLYSNKDRKLIQFNLRDVTERKKFERQVQDTQKLETLGRLAGGIAHDFNNLLTGVMGNASLGYSMLSPEEPARQQFREIELSSEKAAVLIRQMLAYAGKGQYVIRKVHIGELIREILPLTRTSMPRSVRLDLNLTERLPPIDADASQVQQVVMNLVLNGAEAVGAGNPGRVEVRTSLREVSERDAVEEFGPEHLLPGPHVMVEVSDTGVGMSEATQCRIFDPFYSTKFTGRGLGLAATLGIVRAHGGALRVRSAPGKGSTFSVLFPVGSTRAAFRDQLPAGAVILVVGNDRIDQLPVSAVLAQQGCKVLSAHTSVAGVELFREHNELISAVLLEYPLPGVGGAEVLRQIRAVNPGVPVVLCSEFDESEVREHLRGGKPDGFVRKPCDKGVLVKALALAICRDGRRDGA